MKHQLQRFCYSPQGTFSRLHTAEGDIFYCVERPWLGNKPGESCIPVGLYALEAHNSARYPNSLALVGGTVSHFASPDSTRSAIIIHIGNRAQDVIGCIAPGLMLGTLGNSWAVLDSEDAVAEIYSQVQAGDELAITNHIEGVL